MTLATSTEGAPVKPDYLFVHMNDLPLPVLADMFPHRKLVVDGDCGSVWGEFHPEEHPCPFPHVIMLDASEADLEELRRCEIGYVADREREWGNDEVLWRWREDVWCNARECNCDHRSVYVEPTRRRKS
jgi:hypothetical protein